MITIRFNVYNQRLECLDKNTRIAAGAVNTVLLHFNFHTDDWDNTVKVAKVYHESGLISNKILDSNNECLLPARVIREGKIQLSVSGKGNSRVITTEIWEKEISPSTAEVVDDTYEPGMFEQLAGRIEEIATGDVPQAVQDWLEAHKDEIPGASKPTTSANVKFDIGSDGYLYVTTDDDSVQFTINEFGEMEMITNE